MLVHAAVVLGPARKCPQALRVVAYPRLCVTCKGLAWLQGDFLHNNLPYALPNACTLTLHIVPLLPALLIQ